VCSRFAVCEIDSVLPDGAGFEMTEGDQQVVGGSSPYATGGGGVQLEREFGASALAFLLLEQPIPGLGDEFVPFNVAMQQSALTAVDDVVIRGRSPGGERSLQVACRRSPTIGKSDKSTVKLFADYLQVILVEKEALAGDRLRLGLAVSGPHTPSRELAILTDVARVQPSRPAFKAAIDAEGAGIHEVPAASWRRTYGQLIGSEHEEAPSGLKLLRNSIPGKGTSASKSGVTLDQERVRSQLRVTPPRTALEASQATSPS
jgi:hypothetical protein